MRRINPAGLELIKTAEGLRLKAYKDVRGLWTVGWGHHSPDLTADSFVSADGANTLLDHDLEVAEECVDKAVIAPLTDNQFSALVSLCYNIGIGSFRLSTLVKYLNVQDYTEASEEFLRWCHNGTDVVPGLLARRKAEQALFREYV